MGTMGGKDSYREERRLPVEDLEGLPCGCGAVHCCHLLELFLNLLWEIFFSYL